MFVRKAKASSATITPIFGKCNLLLKSSNGAFKDDFPKTAATFTRPLVPTSKYQKQNFVSTNASKISLYVPL